MATIWQATVRVFDEARGRWRVVSSLGAKPTQKEAHANAQQEAAYYRREAGYTRVTFSLEENCAACHGSLIQQMKRFRQRACPACARTRVCKFQPAIELQ